MRKTPPKPQPQPQQQNSLFAFGFSSKKKEERELDSPAKTAVPQATAPTPQHHASSAAPMVQTSASTPSKPNPPPPAVAAIPDTPKRRKIVVVDSDSDGEEAKPAVVSEASSGSESSDDDQDNDEEEKASPPKRSRPSSTSPAVAAAVDVEVKAGVLATGEHEHNLLPWFQQDRKDLDLRSRKTNPEFNPSTLFVPPGYLAGQPAFHAKNPRKITDAIKVWWDFYSRNADCVLFFKVGKFYEMYHACADVGVKHCDLLYMKGDVAHCGFPEVAWAKNMSKLVSLNYRVCRIEQTETVQECALRTGKKTGMVRREICQVLSPGTMTLQIRDEFAGYDNHGRNGLLSISEHEGKLGMCLVDASTGKFQLGEFDVDEHLVGLRSLLAFENPAEICYCAAGLSEPTLRVLRAETKPLHSPVAATASFPAVESYFKPNEPLPELLQHLSPSQTKALGYCLTVLKRSLIDEELVTMRQFTKYVVSTQNQHHTASTGGSDELLFMRMDNQCLFHLEIFANNQDGTAAGSLFEYLNRTRSKFAGRMLREWVCRPLASQRHLLQRQAQVTKLMPLLTTPQVQEFRKALGHSPDLERNLSKIHALGLKRKDTHPDSRAVIYSSGEVNKVKIEQFCATLASLRQLRMSGAKICALLEEEGELFAETCEALQSSAALQALDHFDRAFDPAQAKKLGAIEPRPGVAPEFDHFQSEVDACKGNLRSYLDQCKRDLACPSLEYFVPATGKNRYQIEAPETKTVPRDWQLASKKKGVKRYLNAKVKVLVQDLERAELAMQDASGDVTRLVFAEFDKKRQVWASLVRSAAVLDCLLALAVVSTSAPTCLPVFDEDTTTGAYLEIQSGVHPCVSAALERQGRNSFIPNDLELGNNGNGGLMLLTGPNMGGKSTLLRQTCLLAIVAQIGCHVTAQAYRGTIVDAIFTRIGASDRILQGQSTFYVELSETATILHHATNRSLVILDELGRGTSSFDGTAIAHAVVERLVEIGSLSMFATHYHSLVRECHAELGGKVQLAHMQCDSSSAAATDSVLFLYKLAKGCSDRSYGLNVARLAKLPEPVIQRAKQRSMQFEREFDLHMQRRLLEDIARCRDAAQMQVLLKRAKGHLV
ncbi:hypothetical protein BASA81_003683 [Batrachochytrium salamandrivorans]|nr:hypothetical protein BASA81_003683 [Batrachochytrium salamandrivorans]